MEPGSWHMSWDDEVPAAEPVSAHGRYRLARRGRERQQERLVEYWYTDPSCWRAEVDGFGLAFLITPEQDEYAYPLPPPGQILRDQPPVAPELPSIRSRDDLGGWLDLPYVAPWRTHHEFDHSLGRQVTVHETALHWTTALRVVTDVETDFVLHMTSAEGRLSMVTTRFESPIWFDRSRFTASH